MNFKILCFLLLEILNLKYFQRDILKTGGGKSECHSSTIGSKVISMMGNRFQSLHSPHNSDRDFPITSFNNTQNINMIDSYSQIC